MQDPLLADEILSGGGVLAPFPELTTLPSRKSRPRHRIVVHGHFEIEIQLPKGESAIDSFHPQDYTRGGKQLQRTTVATIRQFGQQVGTIDLTPNWEQAEFHTRPWNAQCGSMSQHLHQALRLFFTDIENWRGVPDAGQRITMAHLRVAVMREARNNPLVRSPGFEVSR